MSDEGAAERGSATKGRWPGWVVVLLGLWVIITPFFLGGSDNGFNWLLWSNIVSGLLVAILAGFVASR